jgi:peroxiredoxin
MLRQLFSICVLVAASASAQAMLEQGSVAPAFTLPAAQAGKAISVNSKALLKKGPLVVYFYPAAFTPGCSIEAKLFAEAMPAFEKAGAQVVGISGDDLDTLKRFSVSHCQGRFPVAADQGLKTAKQYQAAGSYSGSYASRVSYVIASDGKVLSSLSDSGPTEHIRQSLATVQKLHAH